MLTASPHHARTLPAIRKYSQAENKGKNCRSPEWHRQQRARPPYDAPGVASPEHDFFAVYRHRPPDDINGAVFRSLLTLAVRKGMLGFVAELRAKNHVLDRQMKHRGERAGAARRRKSWAAGAPGAMVVLSCALAMLAAAPALGSALPEKGAAVECRAVGGPAGEISSANSVLSGIERRKTPVTVSFGHASARRTRLLGTIAIVRRLFIGLLASHSMAGAQVQASLWYAPANAGVQLWEPAAADLRCVNAAIPAAPMPAERAFAIAHLLLAPPRA